MTHLSKKLLRLKLKRSIVWRVSILRRCVGSIRDQVLACWIDKPIRYRQIVESGPSATVCHRFPSGEIDSSCGEMTTVSNVCDHDNDASDLVALKISLLGDNHIGKTSFLVSFNQFYRIPFSFFSQLNNTHLPILINSSSNNRI